MWVELTGVVRFDGVGDLPMKQAAPRSEELSVRGGPNALVYKIESTGHLVPDLAADELLHAGGSRCLIAFDRSMQQAELKAAPDDRPDFH